MADLIYRQKAIEQAEKKSQVEGAYGYMDTKSIVDMLEDLPIVDAVEVIRCKDCKFFTMPHELKNYHTLGVCSIWNECSKQEDYCSYAERKENGEV